MFLEDIKKKLPAPFKDFLKYLYSWPRTIGRPKIFCISMQRNGTTSVGVFLKDHGYKVASYGAHSKHWSSLWYKGDYERIFHSLKFKSFQAYEDNPWWFPDFYRVLNYRFPNAKFILMYRDSNKWFDSMINHTSIRKLINNYEHNKIYRKLDLFYEKCDNDPSFQPNKYDNANCISFDDKREHYIKVYEEYNREVVEYFKRYAPNKLFVSQLTDKEKWKNLSQFLQIKVATDYEVHANKTQKKETVS